MDRSNWIQEASFVPSLWLHPLIHDKAGCEKAIGNFLVGSIQSYDKKTGHSGEDQHFFTVLTFESNIPFVQVYTPGDGGKGSYEEVPFKAHEIYSLRAPGNLLHQLKRYCTDASYTGVPLEITFIGLKDIEVDNPNKPGTKMTVTTYQYRVRRDPSWTAIPGEKPIMLLSAPAAVVEDPLPPLEDA